jgi:galactose oxidase-like protein
VLPAEMWSPTTQTWTTLSSLQISRLYHSIAILLPDGRVLVGAGGRWNGYPPTPGDPAEHPNAEIFSPPYLFKGPQPTITSAPGDGSYGSTIAVATPNAASIASVSLIKLASVTHAFNMDQRFVPLSFTQSGGGLNVTLPANANLAPPGYYMLFIVDSNGVPSTAAMIRMHP